MKQKTLAHKLFCNITNIFNRYLPALLYLPSTTPFYVSTGKGAASTIFLHLWYGAIAGSEPMTSRSERGHSTN